MSTSVEAYSGQVGVEHLPAYAVDVEDMSVRYGQIYAVRNLSMHVPHGSIYGLVGPAGAGKSTTMRVLATLQQPDTGSALVDGIDIQADPAAVRERIGYLPDFAGVYESLTVGEYLDFYGEIYGIPSRRRRRLSDELLELVGLTEQRDRPVRALSRGMKQQLGVARCLIHDPQILLLDEPAAGMDPRSRRDLRDILQELRGFGKTVLISSHLLSELAEVCTHLGIMQSGALLAEGTAEEIMDAIPTEPVVRLHVLDAGNREAARLLLESHPACRRLDYAGESTLLVQVDDPERDAAAILGHLCANGVQVIECTLEHQSLEEVFLQVTARKDAT